MDIEEQKTQLHQLVTLVNNIVAQDTALRAQYQIGDKFRFIRDHLQTLVTTLENQRQALEPVQKNTSTTGVTHIPVYIYLYNTKGLILKSWQDMLMPKLFYEYSVNRPVYAEKRFIEEFLRSRNNLAQHAYLTAFIDPNDILSAEESKDLIGNPLIKVREGSLHSSNFVVFTHNEQDYVLDARGNLIKKKN